jgi:energy-coupling factor transporter ATP-binding protein EcfA2/cell division protein FtsB
MPSPHLELATTAPALAPGGAPPVRPGTVLKHYEIIRKLGAGGMGMVFLARDTRLGRLVAIKFLLEYSGSFAERFLAEARATARCRHENIVVIYDVDELDGHPYMVLEYMEGRTMQAFMSERAPPDPGEPGKEKAPRLAPMPPRPAIELILPVVRALDVAHAMGIVHRDLKPSNIFLADTGHVKVLDFGLAKQIGVDLAPGVGSAQTLQAHHAGLTQDGAILGTIPYMAPEQWEGTGIDHRTDLWAIGVMLYELVTGVHPLAPFSPAKLAAVRALDRPMPRVRDELPEASPIAEVIDRCLEKRKERRFASARELMDALERIVHNDRAPGLVKEENPFAGLSAFQEADAARFFGRENDVAAVMTRLRQQELVAIAGPTGAGKSSFVRAGLIPALKRAGREVEAFLLRPGRRPLAALADVLVFLQDTSVAAGAPEDADPEAIAAVLRTQPGYLGARLRARCRRRGPEHRIVLFVDQLEELYTLGIDASERAAFAACLEGVADDASSPLRVLLTVRADFLDHLSEDRRLLSKVSQGLVFLPLMARDGLRDALKKPLEAVRHAFEDDALCEEMLDGLAGTKSALPLLQFTVTKLWEARDREQRLLTRRAYQALGGVAGALSTHAEAVLSALSTAEQRLARQVLLRLVTPERTRAVVQMDELVTLGDDAAAVEQVVHHLANARLVLIESSGEHGLKTVELTHESLLETWGKLRQWLDEDEQDAQFLAQVRHAAKQWDQSGEADGFLWRDRAAIEAGHWLERRRAGRGAGAASGLGKREERYLEAVVRLAERARRRRRRLTGGIIAFLGLFALVFSLLSVQARSQARRADKEAQEAQRSAEEARESAVLAQRRMTEARNATRMASAREHLADPTLVLALVREMEPVGQLPPRWHELALWARYQGIASVVLYHPDGVLSAAFSPDGERIVSASSDGTARVWNADSTGKELRLEGHRDIVNSAAWSPDGRRIVTASYDGTARVWSADGKGRPVVLEGHRDIVWSAAFSPDGLRVVTASADRTVRVWSADGKGRPVVLEGHREIVYSAAFSPDGLRIATASYDRTARVWNADGAGRPVVLEGHRNSVRSTGWSPDGRRIVTASIEHTL